MRRQNLSLLAAFFRKLFIVNRPLEPDSESVDARESCSGAKDASDSGAKDASDSDDPR
jgi:hypothetical protein